MCERRPVTPLACPLRACAGLNDDGSCPMGYGATCAGRDAISQLQRATAAARALWDELSPKNLEIVESDRDACRTRARVIVSDLIEEFAGEEALERLDQLEQAGLRLSKAILGRGVGHGHESFMGGATR
jgi:hypothetical protein